MLTTGPTPLGRCSHMVSLYIEQGKTTRRRTGTAGRRPVPWLRFLSTPKGQSSNGASGTVPNPTGTGVGVGYR